MTLALNGRVLRRVLPGCGLFDGGELDHDDAFGVPVALYGFGVAACDEDLATVPLKGGGHLLRVGAVAIAVVNVKVGDEEGQGLLCIANGDSRSD